MTTIQSTNDPSVNACNEPDDIADASGATQSSPQPPPPNTTLVVSGGIKGSTNGGVEAMVTADLHMLGNRRGDAINASPENQWATYDSLLAKYEDDLAAYNESNKVWKAYDDTCAGIDAANAEVPAYNQKIDEQIAATGEEIAALTTLNNFLHSCHPINLDGTITQQELLDMAHAEAGTFPLFLSQDVINAAKHFESHMDQWGAITANGNLSVVDAPNALTSLGQIYSDLPSQKKKVQPHPPPPPGGRPTAPRKPQQPHVPRPASTNSNSSTSSTGSKSDPKETGATSDSKDTDSTDSTTKAKTDKGPKISQKDKSGAGGIEGAMVHAQDRIDQIGDRLAWVEDEIGRLEVKSPLTPAEKQELSDLRAEKIKLTRAMQSASEAYTSMMTLITNMMKMYADMQKAIINNMR